MVLGRGRLRSDYLAQLDPWAGVLIGALAMVGGAATVRLWRLWEPSEHRFGRGGIERGTGRAPWDAPPLVLRWIYVGVFLQLGLFTLDNRALARLIEAPSAFSPGQAEFCREEAEEVEQAAPPGCALVRRAFELGYAATLGQCEPRAAEQVASCSRRQRDEPYLHYAWRLLSKSVATVRGQVNRQAVQRARDQFSRQWEQIADLVAGHREAVTASPRASHHLFTNLPRPRQSLFARVADAIDPGRCVARFAQLPDLPALRDDAQGAASAVEHVVGQLLFSSRFEPVVGLCREYTIHWNAPADACQRLAADPEGFLDETGARPQVQAVLARRARQRAVRGLVGAQNAALAPTEGTESAAADAHVRGVTEVRAVSFQCFTVSDRAEAEAAAVVEFAYAGHRFRAASLSVPEPTPGLRGVIALYRQLASVLAPGFSYTALASRESRAGRQEEAAAFAALDRPGYLLAKAELLRDADIFLGHQWIDERADLQEIYPYHLHLTNFVEVFRQRYQLVRGRL
jgi:hypothetical protein